ncbi:alpha/beta fold hydrolase [Mycoplasmopsis verecunda]|uniref:Lysophospholipase, alpha-beta hydrolase superfamily n=1 Tax=Mycoplasmopsis verecunda TaxID=171291 RepID=A0A1T4MH69_9BACT|nr:alpha/beta hydrolase [Mycoplasmopsis verecunda]WPB54537.1 alpha/beta hydrolase [Mycoplasmopsis verecunda]SJZ66201.1 Lysophospholipase, alpha-beta hydrolase superfamily [Mycoplasmopsis verecunda]
MEEIILKSHDNYELSLHLFEVENPKGYVQIIHGMEEHQDRYNYFVSKINQAGYTVLTSDMRGHGKNAPVRGFFAEEHGDKVLLDDYKLITNYYLKRFNIDKVILFAHSMGTIIARNLMQTESNKYAKVILSGYPTYFTLTPVGIALSHSWQYFKGAATYSPFINYLSVGAFNKKIKNPRTKVDWISKNPQNVDDYLNDDLCGIGFKISAFKDLFHLTNNLKKVNNYKDVNNIPILMIRGAGDPCTGYAKGAKRSRQYLQKAGFSKIKYIDYPNCRHELLNEEIKDIVIDDIISFINE